MRRGRARTLFVLLAVGWVAGCAAILGLDEVSTLEGTNPDARDAPITEVSMGGEGGGDVDAADASEVSLDAGCEGSACPVCSKTWDFGADAPEGFLVPQELTILSDSGLPPPSGLMVLNGATKSVLVPFGTAFPGACLGQVVCDFDVQFSETDRDVVFARLGTAGGEVVRVALTNGKVTVTFPVGPPTDIAPAPAKTWLHIQIEQTDSGAMVQMEAGSAAAPTFDASAANGFNIGEVEPWAGDAAPFPSMLIDNLRCAKR